MSQKKVDAYKEYKKNRTKILKREKRLKRIEIGAISAVVALLVFWCGWSIYKNVDKNLKAQEAERAAAVTEVDMNSYINFLGDIQTTYSAS